MTEKAESSQNMEDTDSSYEERHEITQEKEKRPHENDM